MGFIKINSFDTETWNDIVAITEVNHKGWEHCIGLKGGGTLVYTGDKKDIQFISELG